MKEKLEEINDCIRECFPIIIFVSWICMIALCIKVLFNAVIK